MKFMTVLIFSPAVWQSGAGCKASTLQLMQISALQCVFLLFLCSDHEVSLPVSSGPWNLGLLPSGWLQVREVASCRQLVVCMGTGSISHQPVLMPSMCVSIRAVADSTWKASSCCGQWEFCHWLVTIWITALMLMERYWLWAAENITRCFIRKTSTNVQIKAQR